MKKKTIKEVIFNVAKSIAGVSLLVFLFLLAVPASQGATGMNLTDGFKWYKFNSVEVQLKSSAESVAPGEKINFTANVNNGNNYPIVDASVFVKVFRRQSNEEKTMRNSDFLVDQFIAAEGISLNAKGTVPIKFDWKVPTSLEGGDYYVATFVQSDSKFNLLGLPFTDDVIGNTSEFTVSGKQKAVSFDKNSVKLNSKEYNFVSFLASFGEKDEIKIEAPLVNGTAQEQKVSISKKLFYWDGMLSQNQIDGQKEEITLKPNETKTVSWVVSGNSFPVNYVVIQADWQDSHSILDVRFSRFVSQDPARINFSGISSFPLVAGQKMTVFSGGHLVKPFGPPDENAKTLTDKNNFSLELALKDKDGETIETFSYKGPLEGKIQGMEAEFAPAKDYDYVALESTLKDGQGKMVDQATLTYDCAKINPDSCSKNTMAEILRGSENQTLKLVIILTVLVVLILLVILIIKKWKDNSNYMRIILLAAVLGLGCALLALSGNVNVVKASSIGLSVGSGSGSSADVLFDPVGSDTLYDSVMAGGGNSGGSSGGGGAERVPATVVVNTGAQEKIFSGTVPDMAYLWLTRTSGARAWAAMDTVNSSVTYRVTDYGVGNSLNVGSTFVLEDLSSKRNSRIVWNATGYTTDSPFGCWNEALTYDSDQSACDNPIYENFDESKSLYARLLFQSPKFYPVIVGNATCSAANVNKVVDGGNTYDSKWNCQITGTGVVNITLRYLANQGVFWYRSVTSNKGTITKRFQKSLLCSSTANEGCSLAWTGLGSLTDTSEACSAVAYQSGAYRINGANCGACEACTGGDFLLGIPAYNKFVFQYNIVNTKPTVTLKCAGITGQLGSICPTDLVAGVSYDFTATATDPTVGRTISQVEVKWEDQLTGTINNFSPPVTPAVFTFSRSFASQGIYRLSARATNSLGTVGDWSTPAYEVNVVNGPALTVAKIGDCASTSTVISSPAGIDCGATCAYSFQPSISVTLNETPNTGCKFSAWSNTDGSSAGCLGGDTSSSCLITTGSTERTINANFTNCAPQYVCSRDSGDCTGKCGQAVVLNASCNKIYPCGEYPPAPAPGSCTDCSSGTRTCPACNWQEVNP